MSQSDLAEACVTSPGRRSASFELDTHPAKPARRSEVIRATFEARGIEFSTGRGVIQTKPGRESAAVQRAAGRQAARVLP